jgi:hypothetical protein
MPIHGDPGGRVQSDRARRICGQATAAKTKTAGRMAVPERTGRGLTDERGVVFVDRHRIRVRGVERARNRINRDGLGRGDLILQVRSDAAG